MVNLTQRQKTLPTMYDLPSEEVGEPGLPDHFHPLQAQFLDETFQPQTYPSERVFSAMDLNIYYDEDNTRRYKRPDWFGVVGVPWLYEERDLRMSYVIWQERVNPFIIVELLSPSTQAQDLGQVEADTDEIPTKWEVYEQYLQVPYYVVYNREQNHFRVFHLENNRYQELEITNNQFWFEELGIGLRLWQGSYKRAERLWLRFCDASGELIPTEAERAEQAQTTLQETQTALQELQDRLLAMGLDPNNLPPSSE